MCTIFLQVITKVKMNSDIQQQTTAIFSIESLSKTGHGLVYVMVDFVRLGFLDQQGTKYLIHEKKFYRV